MKLVLLAVFSISLIGIIPVYAESQTLPTDGGTLDVKLEYDEITPGELTTLNTDFINPQTQQVQEHIDWTLTVSKDGESLWGPTPLSHTSEGSLKNLKYEFEEDGTYNLEFGVEGILFQPIPLETVSFVVVVGEASAQPDTPPPQHLLLRCREACNLERPSPLARLQQSLDSLRERRNLPPTTRDRSRSPPASPTSIPSVLRVHPPSEEDLRRELIFQEQQLAAQEASFLGPRQGQRQRVEELRRLLTPTQH